MREFKIDTKTAPRNGDTIHLRHGEIAIYRYPMIRKSSNPPGQVGQVMVSHPDRRTTRQAVWPDEIEGLVVWLDESPATPTKIPATLRARGFH